MTTIRQFRFEDLLGLSPLIVDHLTVNDTMFHYQTLLTKWSYYCHVAVAPGDRIVGQILAVTEDHLPKGDKGQVVTVIVDPEYRRMRLGRTLVETFEYQVMERVSSYPTDKDYLVFAYVPVLNSLGRRFFRKIGYDITKTIPSVYPNVPEAGAYKLSKIVACWVD